nr:MAG TPA: hypothetical protein [Caudoviricetes sp.]
MVENLSAEKKSEFECLLKLLLSKPRKKLEVEINFLLEIQQENA